MTVWQQQLLRSAALQTRRVTRTLERTGRLDPGSREMQRLGRDVALFPKTMRLLKGCYSSDCCRVLPVRYKRITRLAELEAPKVILLEELNGLQAAIRKMGEAGSGTVKRPRLQPGGRIV